MRQNGHFMWYEISPKEGVDAKRDHVVENLGAAFAILYYRENGELHTLIASEESQEQLMDFFDFDEGVDLPGWNYYCLCKMKYASDYKKSSVSCENIHELASGLKNGQGICFWFAKDEHLKRSLRKITDREPLILKAVLMDMSKSYLVGSLLSGNKKMSLAWIFQSQINTRLTGKVIRGGGLKLLYTPPRMSFSDIASSKKRVLHTTVQDAQSFVSYPLFFSSNLPIEGTIETIEPATSDDIGDDTNKFTEEADIPDDPPEEREVPTTPVKPQKTMNKVDRQLLALSNTNGSALFVGDPGSGKMAEVAKLLKYSIGGGRNVLLVTTKKATTLMPDLAAVGIQHIETFEVSSAYYKQRVAKDLDDVSKLAYGFWIELLKYAQRMKRPVIAVYRTNDLSPVSRVGRSEDFEEEFWRSFFHFSDSSENNLLICLVCDSLDSECNRLKLRVDNVIGTSNVDGTRRVNIIRVTS